MRRRDFIGIGGSAAMWPLIVRAQQSALPVIGYLGGGSAKLYAELLRGLRQGLTEIGYVEGQNLVIEYRWAEGQNDRLPSLATDLDRRKLAVSVAGDTPSTLALKAATYRQADVHVARCHQSDEPTKLSNRTALLDNFEIMGQGLFLPNTRQ